MPHRALAAPLTRASQNFSPAAVPRDVTTSGTKPVTTPATTQASAITLGVALRYLALRRARLVKPRVPVQRPVLRVVT